MQKLSEETIKHIASLAKISLEKTEIKKFQKELSSIVDYFNKLNEVNTEGIEPTSQVTGLINKLRDDDIRTHLHQKDALKNAPNCEDGYFKTFSPLNDKTN